MTQSRVTQAPRLFTRHSRPIIGSPLRGVDEISSRILWAVLAELSKRYLGDPVTPPDFVEAKQ